MDLAEALHRVPALAGASAMEDLSGGLTNRNVKVTTPSGIYVVRLSSNDTSLLAVDREAEFRNSTAAATTGVAPEVAGYLPGQGVLVVEFLEGRTLHDTDLRDPAVLARAAQAVRTLHEGPRFGNDFDMFDVQQRYLSVVTERGFRLPEGYLELAGRVARMKAALDAQHPGTVPCNNDLLAENFIDQGDRIRLIDYEYSGNNEACFELGNIWSEAALPLDFLDVLVEAYFGGPSPDKTARCRLLGLLAKIGWTLWAAIQDSVSPIEFDFWGWGMEKYDRARAELSDPAFNALLDTVGGTRN